MGTVKCHDLGMTSARNFWGIPWHVYKGDHCCGWKCQLFGEVLCHWAVVWRYICGMDLFSAFVVKLPCSLPWEVGVHLFWLYPVVMGTKHQQVVYCPLMFLFWYRCEWQVHLIQMQQPCWWGCWQLLECWGLQLIGIDNLVPCFVHPISIQMWCCMWKVIVSINLPCCLHSCHWGTSAKVCGHCTWWCHIPGDNSSILLWCNRHYRPLVQECSIYAECPWMCVKEMWLVILDHCVPVIAEHHRHHLRHLCRWYIISKGLDSIVWVPVLEHPSGWRMPLGDVVSSQILHSDA